MKILSRVLEGIGFTSLLLGGSGMDNPSIIIPLIFVIAGIGIMAAGMRLDYEFN